MNIKILNNTGFGSFALLDAAIRYAVDNGADVINMSVVGFSNDIFEDALNYAFEKGVVVVAAAGNENLDLNRLQRYPICSDAGDDRYKVIGVSAITEEHHITNFSNVGSDCIDLTAPGENISSTLRFSPTNDLDEKYGGGWTGTSFAAPLVSGTAALLKSIQPGWGPKEIYTAITETAHHTPGQDEIAYAHLFGAGLLQVDKAVQYALERPRILRRQAVASSLFAINKKTGDIYTGFFDDTASTREVYAHLKGVDTVVSYVADDGDVEHIVKRTIDAATSRIEIYNGEWALVQWWVLPFSGDVSIAVGDVLGTAKSEVIIAPKEGGTFYFRVYSISGTLLSEYVTEQEHDGVSLALAADAEREHLQIVLLYDNGAGLTLGVFDGSGVLVDERRLDEPTRRGNIVAADIDADGTDEYILSAGAGNAPFLYYIKTDGALLRKFWGYAGEYTAGISLGKLDYDMDGRDDVLMWSEDGTQPIRIWNYRSQKLFQWQPFEEPVNVSLDVVPTF
jgi:hypothetical protein